MASKKSSANSNQKPRGDFYGRRLGRPLSPARKKVLNELLPLLNIAEDRLTEDGTLDPRTLFSQLYEKCVFEIGFGDGQRLAEHMVREPETAFLGAEPYINGMSAFLKSLHNQRQSPLPSGERVRVRGNKKKDTLTPTLSLKGEGGSFNVRVLMDGAMLLARSLKDECLDALYILNPDPWHKARHHKRRIVNQDNLDHFARILKPGGMMVLTTDVPYLAEWMITETMNHGAFTWLAESAEDWQNPPQNWIHTTYETKGAKGAKCMSYLVFERC